LTLSCKFEGSERLEGGANCEKHDAFSDLEDHVEEEHLGEYFVKSFEEDKVVFIPSTFGLVDPTSLESIELVPTSCVLSPSSTFISDHLSESYKFKFLELETVMTKDFDLNQTLEHTEITRLEDLGPTILPIQLFHDNKICRLMTALLADYEYVCLFDVWAQNFDKLK